MFRGIDFFSDTVTVPSKDMKAAMLEAEVGDEQRGEDPTTRKLEEQVAELLGFESALFFPSATMANEVALRLHCQNRLGEEMYAAENCHLLFAEVGGPAIHSGIQSKPLKTKNGLFTATELGEALPILQAHLGPIPRLVCVENTTNIGGGIPWPEPQLRAVLELCQKNGLKTHLDGARLFNASVATGLSPSQLCRSFDSTTLCFSKGLGCGMGAILAFSKEDFPIVRRLKQLMGGAMRQSGLLAAGALYALENNIQRLAEDHENAKHLAMRLQEEVEEIKVENQPPETNMVFFSWHGSSSNEDEFLLAIAKLGVRFSKVGKNRIRAVTHMGISRSEVDKAVNTIKEMAKE